MVHGCSVLGRRGNGADRRYPVRMVEGLPLIVNKSPGIASDEENRPFHRLDRGWLMMLIARAPFSWGQGCVPVPRADTTLISRSFPEILSESMSCHRPGPSVTANDTVRSVLLLPSCDSSPLSKSMDQPHHVRSDGCGCAAKCSDRENSRNAAIMPSKPPGHVIGMDGHPRSYRCPLIPSLEPGMEGRLLRAVSPGRGAGVISGHHRADLPRCRISSRPSARTTRAATARGQSVATSEPPPSTPFR